MFSTYICPLNSVTKRRARRKTPVFSQPHQNSQLRLWIEKGNWVGGKQVQKQQGVWIDCPAGFALIEGQIELTPKELTDHETSSLAKNFDHVTELNEVKVADNPGAIFREVTKFEEKKKIKTYESSGLAKSFSQEQKKSVHKESDKSSVVKEGILPVRMQKYRHEAEKIHVNEEVKVEPPKISKGHVSNLVKLWSKSR